MRRDNWDNGMGKDGVLERMDKCMGRRMGEF